MDKNNMNPQLPEQVQEEEGGIDFMELAVKLWKGKWFIIIVTVIFGALGVLKALSTPRMYSAKVTLAPEMGEGKSSSSGLSSLASMFGMGSAIGGSTGADALNITLFPEMVTSTPFLTALFDMPVHPYVSKKDIAEGRKPLPSTTLYRWVLGKDKPKPLTTKIKEAIFGEPEVEEDTTTTVNNMELTKEQDKAKRLIATCVSADIDKKTGVTTIAVTIDDPRLACDLADTVCTRLQREIFKYRTAKAAENLEYYTKLADDAREKMIRAQAAYATSVDYNRSVILQSAMSDQQRLQQEYNMAQQLYTQLSQQVEAAKAKYQELKPVFVVVQPATIPLRPINSRMSTLILFVFLGFALSAGWKLYAQDFIKKNLADFKAKLKESNEKQAEAKADAAE